MVSLNVVGLNCGTSIDGIDVAHCRISTIESSNDVKIEVLAYTEVPVDPALRKQVLRLCRPDDETAATSMAEICDLNFALGRQFARAVPESGVDMADVDIVASHGQTLWHQPVGPERSTLQMGEPAVIAQETGRTVVSGFRVAELAAGRQGAPLAGFFESALLTDPRKTIISQNIGGIGNASVVRPPQVSASTGSTYLAFDTGPGNVFIDAAMRVLTNGEKHYDHNGELGALGEREIDQAFVADYLNSEPYFKRQPPKTTGRELFSDNTARRLVEELKAAGKSDAAVIATITRITAESIARAYDQFVLPKLGDGERLDEIYICGGGAHNPNILKHLQQRFPESKVSKLDDAPARIDPNAKEAVMFALLGFLGVCGRTVPTASDAESTVPAIMGVISPGDNYRNIMSTVVQDHGFQKSGTLERIIM